MNKCPYCGAENTTAPIDTPDGRDFMLISCTRDGSLNIPPNGIVVNAFGCNRCGAITLGNTTLINAAINK